MINFLVTRLKNNVARGSLVAIVKAVFALFLISLFGCSNPLGSNPNSSLDDLFAPGAPTGKDPHHLVLLSSNNQTGVVSYPVSIIVGVVDRSGVPVANTSLQVVVTAGGGTAGSTVISDSSGRATISWNLGPSVGTQSLEVSGSGLRGAPSRLIITANAIAGGLSASNSTISGTGPVVADGTAYSTITIHLKDGAGNPVSGLIPSFSATDSGITNVYGACSAGDVAGMSICRLRSRKAEDKTLNLVSPVSKLGGSVRFVADQATKLVFSQSPSNQVAGSSLAAVKIEARDANDNLDAGYAGSVALAIGNNPGSASLGGTTSINAAAGIATFTDVRLNKVGIGYTLTASAAGLAGGGSGSFDISAGAASQISLVSGNSQMGVVDTNLGSEFKVLVTDASGNPVPSATVDWIVSSGGGAISASSLTNGSGVSSATLKLGQVAGGNGVRALIHGTTAEVSFAASAVASSVVGSISWSAAPGASYTASNSTAMSVITAAIRDSFGNVITSDNSTVVTISLFAGSGSLGGTLSLPVTAGVASFSNLTYTKAETIQLRVAENSGSNALVSSAITVLPAAPNAGASAITAGGNNVNTDGTAVSVTITLKDAFGNSVPGIATTFSASGSGNSITQPVGVTNASGQATGSIASSISGTKALSIATPGGLGTVSNSVTFVSTAAVAAQSSITSTSGLIANGTDAAAVTITLRDASSNPVSGVTPTFEATGSGNTYGACSATNVAGESSCAFRSTKAEAKTISITAPVAKAGGGITFVNGPASQLQFSTQPSGGVPVGAPLASQPVVTIVDSTGNTVTTGPDATANISVSISAGTGTLTGVTNVAASGGIASFAGLAADSQGAGKVITATKASTTGLGGTGFLTKASNAFNINPPAPGAFAITDASPSIGGSISLSWAASSDAAAYRISYGTSAGVYPFTASSNATSPHVVSGLTDGTTYYFMVTASNVTGTVNANAEGSATADAAPPTAPSNLTWAAPYSTLTSSSPALSWSAAIDTGSGISNYQVSLGSTTGAADIVAWTNVGNVSSYTFTSLALLNNANYYASIRAVDSAGNVGGIINSSGFRVDTMAPVSPSSLAWSAPYSASLSQSPILTWVAGFDAGSGISDYLVALGTSVGAADVSSWSSAGNTTGYTFTGVTFTDGGVYYASVKAVDAAGLTSATVTSAAFRVDITSPTAPGSPSWANTYWGSLSTTPALNWSASSDAGSGVTNYQVALGTSAGASDTVAWMSVGSVTSYSFSGLSLSNGTAYYASVRALDGVGNLSNAANTTGAGAFFTTDAGAPSPPTSVRLSANTTASTSAAPTVSWTASISEGVAGFQSYQIALGSTAGATDILAWTDTGIVNSFTPSVGFTLINGNVYYASVRAKKTSGLTSSSASSGSFAVVTEIPGLSLNFLNGSLPLAVQFTRNGGTNTTAGSFYNSAGVLTTSTANYVRNGAMAGAGVGTPGTSPANWTASSGPGGIATSIVGTGNDISGLRFIDIRFFGTASASGSLRVYVETSTGITAAPGQAWTFSEYLAVVAGTTNNINSFNLSIEEYTAGGALLTGGDLTITAPPAALPSFRPSATRTLSDPSVARVRPSLALQVASGAAIDITLRIAAPQMEMGSTATTPILTNGTAISFAPRFDHNPADCGGGICSGRGLLIEEARTNIFGSSVNNSFTATGASLTLNAAAAPDGTGTAGQLVENTGNSRHLLGKTASITAGTTYTYSAFIKAGARSKILLCGGKSASPFTKGCMTVDLSTGAFTTSATGTPAAFLNQYVQALPNGWYRASLAVNIDGSSTDGLIEISAALNDGSTSYTGDGSSGFYVWGGQIEAGAAVSSYIPTVSATPVTRSADNATVGDISWLDPTKGTLVGRATAGGLLTDVTPTVLQAVASLELDNDNRIQIRRSPISSAGAEGSARQLVWTAASSSFAASTATGSWPRYTSVGQALAYRANDFASCANGAALSTGSSGSIPTVNKMLLGRGAVINYLNGWIQSVQYFPQRLGNDQIFHLTK